MIIQEKLSSIVDDRFKYGLSTFIFVLILWGIKLLLISLELVDTGRGDGSTYFVAGALNTVSYVNSIGPWLDIHPPLPEILSGLLFSLYQQYLVGTVVSFVQLCLVALSCLYAISSGIFFATTRNLFDPYTAAIGTLFFASAGLLQIVTLNGNAEAFALVFFMLSSYSFSIYFKKRGYSNLFLSAVFLVLASLCRTEVLIVVPVLCLLLLTQKEYLNSVLFGFLTSAFELIKVVLKKYILSGEFIGYENMEQKWHVSEKTWSYAIFESPTSLHIYSSYGIYFFLTILMAALFFSFDRKPRFFLILFLTFSLIVWFFQVSGRIPDLERYGFFQVICFAFVITSVYSVISRAKFFTKRIRFLVYLVSILIASLNFYLAINDRVARSPQELVDTREWLLEHATTSDSVFIDFTFYWSLNLKQHLASELKAKDLDYKPNIYSYSYGTDDSWGEQDISQDIEWRDIGPKTMERFSAILAVPIHTSNSHAYKIKQKILAEVFIATQRPKYFVVPKHRTMFSPHISKSFIRNKIVPMSDGVATVNFEYLNLDIDLVLVHENQGFNIFVARYPQLKNRTTLFKGHPQNSLLLIQNPNSAPIYAEIKIKSDQCASPLLVSATSSTGAVNKFVFYHLNEGINTLPFRQEYIHGTLIADATADYSSLEFRFGRLNAATLKECVEWLNVVVLAKSNH